MGINGYGTIGRRVADAILRQPDMELAGVTKATPDYRVDEAMLKGIKVFSVGSGRPFEDAGYAVAGSIRDMLNECDVVIDCSTKGMGKENMALYLQYPQLRAIFQGGESHGLTGFSFNSDCNYDGAAGKRFARVVSCNTTALCRILSTLNASYKVRKVRATLVRRSADQAESESSLFNAWAPDMSFPSHHSGDVQTVMPGISITTLAGIAPMTLMHGHMLFVELHNGGGESGIAVTAEKVAEALGQNPRILVCSAQKGLTTTAKLKDMFTPMGRGRGSDLYEVCVWKESIGVDSEGEIGFHTAVDQQADVVPENIDAVRALLGIVPAEESVELTNTALGIGKAVRNIAYVRGE